MLLYQREALGEENYKNYQYISDLLHHLCVNEEKQQFSTPRKIHMTFGGPFHSLSFDTEQIIYNTLEQLFSNTIEKKYIYTNFPSDNYWFFRQLQGFYAKYAGTPVTVQHLIQFCPDSIHSFHNIEALCNILPFMLSNNTNYNARYYYGNVHTNDFKHMLFPYFIITTNFILVISGDLQKHIVYTNPDTINMYTKEFHQINQLAEPLFLQYSLPETMLKTYSTNSYTTSDPLITLEFSPCFVDMVDNDMLSLFLQHHPEYAVCSGTVNKMLKQLYQQDTKSIFTINGIDKFCDTGILTGQIGAFLSPFPKEMRIKALTNLLNRSENHHCNLVSDKIQFPATISFEIYQNKEIHIFQFTPDLKMSLLIINESSICEAFYEFLSSLEKMKLLLSEEESDIIFKNCLNKLKKI